MGLKKRFAQFCTGTVILTFLKIGHDKRFCCFYWKTAANTGNSSFQKTCLLEAKTNVLHNFALPL